MYYCEQNNVIDMQNFERRTTFFLDHESNLDPGLDLNPSAMNSASNDSLL